MGDIDTKTMALLLVAVIALSVLGTAAFLSGVGKVRVAASPTGFATGTGTTTAELSGTVAITMSDNSITFTKGYINISQNDCTLASNMSSGISSSTNSSGCCWINDSNTECLSAIAAYNSETDNSDDNFTLNNTGTVVANLTIKSNTSAADMFGGQNPKVKFAAAPAAIDGTVDAACNTTTAANWRTAWTDVETTEVDLCSDWLYTDTDDEILVWLNFTFARDVVYGTKYATYTFTATEKPEIQ